MSGKEAVALSRTPDNFQGTHTLHTAHRTVIFAIAQLSCFRCVLWLNKPIHDTSCSKSAWRS